MLFTINRARVLLCCTGAVGALAVAGCGSSSNSGSSTPAASTGSGNTGSSSSSSSSSSSASGGTLKIGVEMPVTGPLESLAVNTVNAAKYAAAQVNKGGGVNGAKLSIVTYDTKLDPSTAASDFTQAATSGGVVAMIGPLISPEADAVLPVAARTNTVDIIPAAADNDITTPVKPYIYRTGSAESEDDKSIAAEVKALGCTKPALLYDNGTLGLSTKADIAKDMSFVTSQEISETATDLTSTLQAIKSAGATCIVEGSDDLGALGSMVATMANTGYKVPLLGDSGTSSTTFVAAAGSALNTIQVYGTNTFNPDGVAFKKDFAGYKAMFGSAPTPVEETGTMWDAVNLLAIALKKDGGKGGSALNSAMQRISGSDYTGIGGAAPGFSSSNHEWTTTQSDAMYRILPGGKLQPAKSGS